MYPDPKLLADLAWLPDEREQVVNYLRAEYAVRGSWGYSWCRFRCGISDKAMGSMEYSDGIWLWLHGLPHYVECHDVVLPAEFIEHCRSNNWICPQVRMGDLPVPLKADDSFWIEWSGGMIEKKKAGQ